MLGCEVLLQTGNGFRLHNSSWDKPQQPQDPQRIQQVQKTDGFKAARPGLITITLQYCPTNLFEPKIKRSFFFGMISTANTSLSGPAVRTGNTSTYQTTWEIWLNEARLLIESTGTHDKQAAGKPSTPSHKLRSKAGRLVGIQVGMGGTDWVDDLHGSDSSPMHQQEAGIFIFYWDFLLQLSPGCLWKPSIPAPEYRMKSSLPPQALITQPWWLDGAGHRDRKQIEKRRVGDGEEARQK